MSKNEVFMSKPLLKITHFKQQETVIYMMIIYMISPKMYGNISNEAFQIVSVSVTHAESRDSLLQRSSPINASLPVRLI